MRPERLEVHLGEVGICVGTLFLSSEKRSAFRYTESWLNHPNFFALSPELDNSLAIQYPQEVYCRALEDTAPDSWGERVIRRAHAKFRKDDPSLNYLAPIDYLLWVDDEARIGALRLFNPQSQTYLRATNSHSRIPPLVKLGGLLSATKALEAGTEDALDLKYLLGNGTSLGGARPKSNVIDFDGSLAIGKFPSQADQRDVIRGEVLAMQLADKAGIRTASARVELVNNTAVAIIRRFDRTAKGARIPYLSAASLLQSNGREEHAYTELVEAILQEGADPIADIKELWHRLVFNFLICNTDDHLRNTAFLYDNRKKGWRLSPAFDLNPMPADRRESKTWLTEDTGPITSKEMLIEHARYFRLEHNEAITAYQHIEKAVSGWRGLAKTLGMNASSLIDFEPAFEQS